MTNKPVAQPRPRRPFPDGGGAPESGQAVAVGDGGPPSTNPPRLRPHPKKRPGPAGAFMSGRWGRNR